MTQHPPANWYPDPLRRYEVRYWDGGSWTEHVATQGSQAIDPLVSVAPAPTVGRANTKVERQVRRAGVAESTGVGGGTLFTESVLVVNQKAKVFEVKAEYLIYDRQGRQLGSVRQVGETLMKKALSSRPDATRKKRFQIIDNHGRLLLELTRPSNFVKSRMVVKDANRDQIGQIVQTTLGIFSRVRFRIEAHGEVLGSLNAEDRQAWEFNIQDAAGDEVARITKTWAGLAKERFTKGDHYVVEIQDSLEGPLRYLTIAAALTVDTVLKQDDDFTRQMYL